MIRFFLLIVCFFYINKPTFAEDSQLRVDNYSEDKSLSLSPPPISLVPQVQTSEDKGSDGYSSIIIDGSIKVRQLEAISPESLGILDENMGGLSPSFWEGTPKELIEVLFPKLPREIRSRTIRQLAKNLLLSVATPPESAPSIDILVDMETIVPISRGFKKPEANLVSQDQLDEKSNNFDFLFSRLFQLSKMGQWEDLNSLGYLIPDSYVTERVAILMNDLALVNEDYEVACANATAQLQISNNSYWEKVFAFCQLLEGNIAGGFLTIDLLRERGVEDKAFFWVAELMSGNRPITPNGLQRLSPLQLSMLKSVGRPFPAQFTNNGDPTLLKILSTSKLLYIDKELSDESLFNNNRKDAVELRIRAAERALELGVIKPKVIHELYRNAQVDIDLVGKENESEELNSEENSIIAQNEEPDSNNLNLSSQSINSKQGDISRLDNMSASSPLERAALFRLAEEQVIPTAKAEVISRAIDIARGSTNKLSPDIITVGIIYSSLILNMEPSGDLIWFAGNAIRALIASGFSEEAIKWLDLSRSYSRTSIEASEASAALWPIERQIEPKVSNVITPIRIKRWSESRPRSSLDDDKVLILSTLVAAGDIVPKFEWLSVMDKGIKYTTPMPAPHIWEGLQLASKNLSLGETILFSIISLSNLNLEDVSPIVLSQVIKSLIKVGLEREARNLAVEAMLLRGL